MKILHPNNNDIFFLKEMWKNIFGDTESYVDLFFSEVQTAESTLVVKLQNKVIAMVFYPEYSCNIGGKETKCGYICGAATLPEYRGQGVMGKLLNAALEDMKSRNYGACVLIPAGESLFNYYKKFGFIKNTCYRIAENVNISKPFNRSVTVADNVEDIWDIYCKATENISNIVIQSKESYKAVMEEYEGRVYLYDKKCFMFVNGNTVDEIFAKESSAIPEAISAIQEFLNIKICSIRCYSGYLKEYGEIFYNGMFLNLQNFAPSDNIYLKMVLE